MHRLPAPALRAPPLLADFFPRPPAAALFDLAPRLPPAAFEPPRAELLRALDEPDLLAVFFDALPKPLDLDAPRAPADFELPDVFAVEPPGEGRDVLPAPPVFARDAVAPLLDPRVPDPPDIPVAAPVFCAAPGVEGVPVIPVTSVSKMLGSIGAAGFTLFGRPRRLGAVTAKRSASSSSSSVASGVTPGSSSSSSWSSALSHRLSVWSLFSAQPLPSSSSSSSYDARPPPPP